MDRINAELSAERSVPPSIDKENTNMYGLLLLFFSSYIPSAINFLCI